MNLELEKQKKDLDNAIKNPNIDIKEIRKLSTNIDNLILTDYKKKFNI